MLDPGVANELRGIEVEGLSKKQLVELSTIIGLPRSGNKEELLARLRPVMTAIDGWLLSVLHTIIHITLHI